MKHLLICICCILWLVIFPAQIPGQAGEPQTGSPLPRITLNIPEDISQQKYLGLGGNGTFEIPQIRSKVVIIEIFSMYCPHCQKHAPSVNRLYEKIQRSETLRNSIKIIGIGAGNSQFEVDFFRKTYAVPFPLFPDANLSIHDAIGQVRTPYFIALVIKSDGTDRVIYTQLGGFNDPDQFLNTIVSLSGL